MNMAALCSGPTRDRAAIRRERIVDAARILFIENGFHATGVAQIAKASGVAVGQIYRDFEAKEEIVSAIVESDCARFMARESLSVAIAARDGAVVWEWLRQFIMPAERYGTEHMFAEIVAESARNERIAAIFARTRADVDESMQAALALLAPGEGIAERRAMLADLILTQSLGLKQQRLLQPEMDFERLAEMMLALIAREIESLRVAAGEPVCACGGRAAA